MKRLLLILCIFLPVLFFFSCPTVKKAEVEEGEENYYSMVYDLAIECFLPVAENYINAGDSVLIVNADKINKDLIYRFIPLFNEFSISFFEKSMLNKNTKINALYRKDEKNNMYILKEQEHKLNEAKIWEDFSKTNHSYLSGFNVEDFLALRPYFIEYLENGFVRTIIENSGMGFERLDLVKIKENYMQEIYEEQIVFNTNFLKYDKWEDIKKDLGINKILIYSIKNIIDKSNIYIGMSLDFKLLDLDRNGKILWEGNRKAFSRDFPAFRMNELYTPNLTIPENLLQEKIEKIKTICTDEGIPAPIDVVLLKIDDIPLIGSFPITVEDYAVEFALASQLSKFEDINILEKLYYRLYKKAWQFMNAIYYINPLLGGEYDEFEKYYGARFALGYRVLWKNQVGINFTGADGEAGLMDKIIGIYVKLIDMLDNGRILYCDFIPIAPAESQENNFIYKSYKEVTDSLVSVIETIDGSGMVLKDEKLVVINKRMELLKNHLENSGTAIDSAYKVIEGADNITRLLIYENIYDLLDMNKMWENGEVKKEVSDRTYDRISYILAANIVHSWYEEGLIHALVNKDFSVLEKMESIYSRYQIKNRFENYNIKDNIFLSPLLLTEWGEYIKWIYDVDKVLYYSPLEKHKHEGIYLLPPRESAAVKRKEKQDQEDIAIYLPFLKYDLEWFLFSVLDINTGQYVYNKNFELMD